MLFQKYFVNTNCRFVKRSFNFVVFLTVMFVTTFSLFFQLIAVFDEHDVPSKTEDGITITDRLSPDPFEAELEAHNPTYHPLRGEIEVTPSALKLGMLFSYAFSSA